ncbi:hypothetical protein OPT61_g2200 [Boeremia exigua]|uniref:Uncharacterized protein n=1 Tax=Boeremia exigua TaxID=749465 RepID=A0ACC2IMA8_9PLEO|nr:hypothetical protein OPT61_g2200 [Boeremia exigua]
MHAISYPAATRLHAEFCKNNVPDLDAAERNQVQPHSLSGSTACVPLHKSAPQDVEAVAQTVILARDMSGVGKDRD